MPDVTERLSALAIAALLAVATWVDWRSPTPVTAIFSVPILLAALTLPARGVLLTAALAVGLDLSDTLGEPWPSTLIEALTEVLVGALAVLVARQRRALQDSARELEAASERQQLFLGMVSHEIRTPLSSLSLRLQLARRFGDEPRTRLDVPALERSVQHIQRLVDDLHDVALIGTGNFQVQARQVEVAALVRQAASELVLDERHRLRLELPEALVAWCDPERLRQVCLNLLTNALKYSPEGGEVRVGLAQRGDNLELSVADPGVGLSPAQQAQLFEAFQRAGADPATRGTGLGLYISRAIAQAHHGQLAVESAPGRGSTFTLRLPLGPSEPGQTPGPLNC